MANRTTAQEVKNLMGTDLGYEVIDSFITTANLVVTDVLGSTTLGSSLLAEIEKWLAAHFIAMSRERDVRYEEVDQARVEYMGKYGMNLDATRYGQTVKTLDSTGKMSGIGGKLAGLWAM
jgi:hypothetical protein